MPHHLVFPVLEMVDEIGVCGRIAEASLSLKESSLSASRVKG